MPPASLIFLSASRLTYRARTTMGISGMRPLPNTLAYPNDKRSNTGAVSVRLPLRYSSRASAGTRLHNYGQSMGPQPVSLSNSYTIHLWGWHWKWKVVGRLCRGSPMVASSDFQVYGNVACPLSQNNRDGICRCWFEDDVDHPPYLVHRDAYDVYPRGRVRQRHVLDLEKDAGVSRVLCRKASEWHTAFESWSFESASWRWIMPIDDGRIYRRSLESDSPNSVAEPQEALKWIEKAGKQLLGE